MKFLNKYELMEPITGGAVETFVARELASGERVIVHMFTGSEVLPDKPALQWALQSLRGLAPTPMGSVIEGGRYEQTTHAYLVTKFPADPVALEHWIRFYTMQAEATQPTLGTPAPISSPIAQLSSEKNKQPIGEFTRAFFGSATADVDSQSRPGPDKAAETKAVPDPADNWSRKPAGAFTKEFLSGFDLAPEIKKAAGSAGAVQESRKPQSFTAEFLMAGNEAPGREDKPATANKNSISGLFSAPGIGSPLSPPAEEKQSGNDLLDFPAPAGNAGTGEFTKFFRGPFGGQSTSGAPAGVNLTPPSRPREKAGEFTQLFGSGAKSPPVNESGGLLEPAAPRQSGNFTELFRTPASGGDAKSDAVASSSSLEETAWNRRVPSPASGPDSGSTTRATDRSGTFGNAGVTPATPPRAVGESTALFANEIVWDRPATPRPAVGGTGSAEQAPGSSAAALDTVAVVPGATKSAATSVFTPPGSPSAAPLPGPSGPSEYTRIISPPKPAPSEEAKPTPAAAPAAPAFSLPQVAVPPPMPKAPTPAMPQPHPPQLPHLQTPQIPSAPQPPQAPAPALPQRFSYWPLIIVMNILLILAVAVILYFALKH